MINKKVLDAINEQINKEVYSAYFYQSMAAYASYEGLNGIANWFNVQVQEELSHAKVFYNYVIQQGEKIELKAIEQPPVEFESPKQLFEQTLEHEKYVSRLINDLYSLAKKENDNATEILLQWFVSEQVEEEANASDILSKFKMVGGEASGLFMIDTELAKRVFTPPSILAN
jgi:ferritin